MIRLLAMSDVSIRELRNSGGKVIDRVARGETLTITRSGKPVAELRPLIRPPAPLRQLVDRRRAIPEVDPDALRREIDELVDPHL